MSKNVGLKRVLCDKLYTHYNKITKGKKIKNRSNFLNIAKEILSTVQENIIEKEGGVVINNFGYFFVFRVPAKQMITIAKKDKEEINLSKYDFKRYTISFCPTKRYSEWHMISNKHYKLRKGVSEKLNSGFYYKNYLGTLKKMKIL